MISDSYRALNQELHLDRPTYGAGGYRWATTAARLIQQHAYRSVLDYGCGKGTMIEKLRGLVPPNVWLQGYDPSFPPFTEPPREADLVMCTDVLEHIEPEHLDAVLADLARLTKKRCVCVIATRPAKKTLPDGRNAHLIVEAETWWLSRVSRHFAVVTSAYDAEKDELLVQLGPKIVRCAAVDQLRPRCGLYPTCGCK